MPSVRNAVTGVGIELRYGPKIALAASDFVVPEGKTTALIGPNGSGKSTMLAAIAGLHSPSAGRLRVLDSDPRQVRRRIALVMQATKVNEGLPVTVREVVAMGRYASRGLLGRLGADDRTAIERALEELDLRELAGRRLHELSGGQRQRVFVAQGLTQEHDLLLLDEPTTGLDLPSSEAITRAVEAEKNAGRTVVLTTHDLSEAATADHVILLAGQIVAQGEPHEVLTAEVLSKAYEARILDVEGRILIDDSAHRAAGRRHVHREREGRSKRAE